MKVPRQFSGVTLADYDPAIGDEKALAVVDLFIDTFPMVEQGLLLFGPPGTGKTMLASIILNELNIRDGFFTFAAYVRTQQRLFDLKAAWQKMGDAEAYEQWVVLDEALLQYRNHTPLAVLDDVGKEHLTASNFAQDEFHFLIRNRQERGLPTIITTNHPSDEAIAEVYGESTASFLHEICHFVPVVARDARRRRAGR